MISTARVIGMGMVAIVALLVMVQARASDADSIVHQGNGKGAPPCLACHGANGEGQAASGNPRLAGLDAAYLRKQLEDFTNSSRTSPVMQSTASALTADERNALAVYYSKLPIPSSSTVPPTDQDAGGELATRGHWSQQIPGCVQCHGPAGTGVGANFPPLAGQPAIYIEAQLKAWQHGTRHNDPLQLMQHLSASLSEQDIHDVASWFAAQSAVAKGATP
ncbi:c-type cytochrome [Rhodanobacter sp. L36]|uniref:c-type cytochrome n=1 Tax=Rhodanobacter sp. L36 TaxID=1747221 RepID=UPI0020B12666|nr:c-type cytochrome [Rhodanobacter sp. L36]